MKMHKISVCSVDFESNAVIVEFENGTIGRYEAQFLLDHINSDGNWDVSKQFKRAEIQKSRD
jgi:hypothetical protein